MQASKLKGPMSCMEVGHLPFYTRRCSLSNLENKGSLLVQKRVLKDCLQQVRVLGSEISFGYWLDWLSEDCHLALSRGYRSAFWTGLQWGCLMVSPLGLLMPALMQ
mmetsp:Transcript_26273/g.62379  ORF Transcript_26273/g.62379 Transcript_26273/m.62379 type:complete len:106 (+) Transcript_26273:782-1099(+)